MPQLKPTSQHLEKVLDDYHSIGGTGVCMSDPSEGATVT